MTEKKNILILKNPWRNYSRCLHNRHFTGLWKVLYWHESLWLSSFNFALCREQNRLF